MKIKENDNLPNSEIFVLQDGEPVKKNIEDFFKDKKVVIFGLPGAYTSVCSAKQYTMFVDNMKVIKLQEEADTGSCEISAAENFFKLI